jgi:hypothetical protein
MLVQASGTAALNSYCAGALCGLPLCMLLLWLADKLGAWIPRELLQAAQGLHHT